PKYQRMIDVFATLVLLFVVAVQTWSMLDRKSTRLNSSHANISYAVFCLKKKAKKDVIADYKKQQTGDQVKEIRRPQRTEGIVFFNDTATTEIYTLSLHDALPILWALGGVVALLGAFVWAELASRYPQVGGQYVYLQRAYHPVVGFLYGIALLFIINGGSLAAVSILFASYVDRSFVPLGGIGIRAAAAMALVV